MKNLEPILSPYRCIDKIRVGSIYDGGYILPKQSVHYTDCILSFGVSTNFDFERQMFVLNQTAEIHMYDPFIGPIADFKRLFIRLFSKKKMFTKQIELKKNETYIKKISLFSDIIGRIFHWIKFYKFKSNNKIFFNKKGLRNYIDSTFTNFHQIFSNINISNKNSIIIKMDIEGDEYKVYHDLLNYSDKISVVLLEIHEISNNEIGVKDIIEKFRNKGLFLIHIHGNNSDVLVKNTSIPNTLELSFAKLSYCELIIDNMNYPIEGLDAPCNPYLEDYKLEFLSVSSFN